MSVLIEVIVGAVLSILMSTEEIQRDPDSEKAKLEQVSEVSFQVNCKN